MTGEQQDNVRRAATLLREAERPVRVLRTIAWPAAVRERFFAAGAKEMPVVSYPLTNVATTRAKVAEARSIPIDDELVRGWVARQADAVGGGAEMLAAVGTPHFHAHSARLYGTPGSSLGDGSGTPLDLARRLTGVLEQFGHCDLGAPETACHLDTAIADRIRATVAAEFGASAPAVEIADDMAANAVAGASRIRIRRGTRFSDRDAEILIQHEAMIHILTSLNGQGQPDLPILVGGHPGTTSTQEGLAVFAELVTGVLEPARLRRLADRVLAIQMAIDGADFLEVYRFFLDRGVEAEAAFDSARRVFRGGVLTGGAPFTKDVVYLHGLLRVHELLRAAITAGRADLVRLLFCGKLDLEDLPAIAYLASVGLCRPPTFLPPWARDMRYLVSFLAYGSFLSDGANGSGNGTGGRLHDGVRQHTAALLAAAPVVAPAGAPAGVVP